MANYRIIYKPDFNTSNSFTHWTTINFKGRGQQLGGVVAKLSAVWQRRKKMFWSRGAGNGNQIKYIAVAGYMPTTNLRGSGGMLPRKIQIFIS